MRIPRIFHLIWLGRNPLPPKHAQRVETWLSHHPDWELRTWTEDALPVELRRPEAAQRLRHPEERADILRFNVLWQFGGVLLDPGIECLRSLEPALAGDVDFFVVLNESGRPGNTLFGATTRHPILDRALDRIRPNEFPVHSSSATGATFFERLLADETGVSSLGREAFNATSPAELDRAYGIRRESRLSPSLGEVWKAVVKAEQRQRAAQKEIQYWRGRCEAAVVEPPAELQSVAPADAARPETRPLKIPRVFHQIWLGPKPFPEEFAHYQQTWLDHHPGWELRFWTEENLPEGLRRPEAADRLRHWGERADILRLELVWRFGGVYVDTDFECLRSLEPLIGEAELFAGLVKPGRLNNALIGGVPGHPALDHALDEIRPREFYGYDKAAAGPTLVARVFAEHLDEMLVLEQRILYPKGAEAKRRAYAVHHGTRVWKDAELLWMDIRDVQDSLDAWRARCKQAEAELNRLRQTWPGRLRRFAGGILGSPARRSVEPPAPADSARLAGQIRP